MSQQPLRERIAAMAAQCLDDRTVVNVGIGIPGLVPHHVPDERGITFHAEQGVIGFGSDRFGPDDGPVLGFFGTTYRMRPGGYICDHTRSFALVRAGLLDVTMLGAFEVEATGMLANFQSDEMGSGCPGGSPELAGAARRRIVTLEHRAKSGKPRLVQRTQLSIGPTRPADLVVTDLGWFVPRGDAFEVERLADGVSPEDVVAATDADSFFMSLDVSRDAGRDASNKIVPIETALDGIDDGATVLIGGWGDTGTPHRLIAALAAKGVSDLTVIITGSGPAEPLFAAGLVRHIVTSFGSYAGRVGATSAFERRFTEGSLTAELCSQGILAERIRAGGAGIPAFYVPERLVGPFRSTDETRIFGEEACVLETALRADLAIIGASVADPSGNLAWSDGERNFNEPMAFAADLVVVEAFEMYEIGWLPPEHVMAPGVVVDRIVAPVPDLV